MESKHSTRARGERKAIAAILTSRSTDAIAFAHIVHAAQAEGTIVTAGIISPCTGRAAVVANYVSSSRTSRKARSER